MLKGKKKRAVVGRGGRERRETTFMSVENARRGHHGIPLSFTWLDSPWSGLSNDGQHAPGRGPETPRRPLWRGKKLEGAIFQIDQFWVA